MSPILSRTCLASKLGLLPFCSPSLRLGLVPATPGAVDLRAILASHGIAGVAAGAVNQPEVVVARTGQTESPSPSMGPSAPQCLQETG